MAYMHILKKVKPHCSNISVITEVFELHHEQNVSSGGSNEVRLKLACSATEAFWSDPFNTSR